MANPVSHLLHEKRCEGFTASARIRWHSNTQRTSAIRRSPLALQRQTAPSCVISSPSTSSSRVCGSIPASRRFFRSVAATRWNSVAWTNWCIVGNTEVWPGPRSSRPGLFLIRMRVSLLREVDLRQQLRERHVQRFSVSSQVSEADVASAILNRGIPGRIRCGPPRRKIWGTQTNRS
jgi:hypothetical protein